MLSRIEHEKSFITLGQGAVQGNAQADLLFAIFVKQQLFSAFCFCLHSKRLSDLLKSLSQLLFYKTSMALVSIAYHLLD